MVKNDPCVGVMDGIAHTGLNKCTTVLARDAVSQAVIMLLIGGSLHCVYLKEQSYHVR